MSGFTLTISREYGSGGRQIGEKLAEALGIGFYDKSIIKMAAEKSGLSPDYIEKSEESIPNTFLFNLKHSAFSSFDSVSFYETPTSDKMFLAQSAVIKEISARADCVIVGRCADYILRDESDTVRVFIHADTDERVRRAVESYNLPGENAAAAIKRIDKSRANYYKYYTNRLWGDFRNYDLSVNTSFTGIEGAVSVIKTMLSTRALIH
ncbi:MAG: cytidylate kinase-like family protein [Oscillospiraceae bacterium]|jgi:cytidylate kinase|nr:cytidylate kinase-like family protein [Oscillospiraceae bacterium]